MRYTNKILGVIAIILMFTMVSSSNASVPATWGVNTGDVAIYELKEAIISNDDATTDLAGSIADSNKTTIIAVTAIGSDFLNYSLGLNNGSNIVPQQLTVEEIDINNDDTADIIAPNGSIPLILPVSVENYKTYMQKLASDISFVNFILSEMFQGQDNVTVETEALLTNNGLLNISGSVSSSNISSITSGFGMNITDFNFQNETLLEVNFEIELSYTRNNGLLKQFNANGQILTNSTELGEIERSFNITILQTEYVEGLEELASNGADSPLYFGIAIPLLLIYSRKKWITGSSQQ